MSTRKPIRLWRLRVLNIDVHHFVHLVSHALPRWIAGSYCRKLPALGAFDRGFRDFANAEKIRQRGAIRRFCEEEAGFETGETECFDIVVLATGYRWRPQCLPVDVKTGDAGHPIANRGKIVNYPGLYVIGAPCGKTLPSEFLHGVNRDAPAIAKAIVRALKRLKF
jgi:hypothetical protein